MAQILWISLGGAVGTAARYLVSGMVLRLMGTAFPYGTWLVNFTGSMLLGLIMHVAVATDLLPSTLRLTLTTGLMGGYTTYSTFNYETIVLMSQGAYLLSALNIVVTLVGCLLGGFLGIVGGRILVGQ